MPTVSGGPDLALVDEALKDILNSASFRSSKQCQALLRYIVDNTLAHNEGLLRERVIGVEVFGRAPDYDTGNDPIVRARAAEVRKRLAQHYLHLDSPVLLRIDIPVAPTAQRSTWLTSPSPRLLPAISAFRSCPRNPRR